MVNYQKLTPQGITLAKKLIGYKTKVPFKQGLQLAIDWYRENLL